MPLALTQSYSNQSDSRNERNDNQNDVQSDSLQFPYIELTL